MAQPQQLATDDQQLIEASARARAKLEFYKHLVTYLVVIGALAALNLTTSASYLWFLWPAAGWGIGLLMHALNVFVLSDRILARMIAREVRRAEQHH